MKNLLTLAREDKTALGFYIGDADLTLAELVALNGFDYLRIDNEHTLMDPSKLLNMIRICNLYDVPTLVRVANISDITRVLDAGASGILVPDVETKAQAEKIVEMCKYYPVGSRGMGMDARHTRYGLTDISEFIKNEPKEIAVCVQIESELGVANVDEIFSVPGVDMVAVGKYDLSQSMGIPGQTKDKRVDDAELEVIKKALALGIEPMVTAGNPDAMRRYKELGVHLMTIAFDIPFLNQALKSHLAKFK